MGYRRLFIMRKDLQMSPGKLAAQVGHCAEVYWLHIFQNGTPLTEEDRAYMNQAITKTICEAKNKNQLLKVVPRAQELGLIEGLDFGYIRDNCLTELEPEDEDGRTLTGIWFRPLSDEIAHELSRKYQLYK